MFRLTASQMSAAALAVLVVLALVLYRDTAASLVHLWTRPAPDNPTYSHGLLLLAICAFLFIKRWRQISRLVPARPSFAGVLIVLGVSLAWFLATLVQVLIVQQLSLWLLIGGLVLTVVGYPRTRLLAMPLALLVFAIPIWEPLYPYLQHFTANNVTLLLNATGISAALEEFDIWVPAGTFVVAPGCSGLAQLIVALMVGSLYAHTNRLRPKHALSLLAGASAVAILANTLRIYTVIVAGQVTQMQHYLVTDHWTLGWVLFGIFMFVFILLANRLVPSATSNILVTALPSNDRPRNVGERGLLSAVALASLALALGPTLVYAYQPNMKIEKDAIVLRLPAQIQDWQATESSFGYYQATFQNADLEVAKLYRRPSGDQVYVYVAYYAVQMQGKEAVYYANRVYDATAWRLISQAPRNLKLSGGSVAETRVRSRAEGSERMIWRWYYTGGRRASRDYLAKLLNVWETLKGNPAMAVIVIITDVERRNEEKAATTLERFLTEALSPLESAIDSAGT